MPYFPILSETLHPITIAIAIFNSTCLVCAFYIVFKHAWGLRETGKRLQGDEHCYALFLTECLTVAPVYHLAPIFNGRSSLIRN